MPFPEPGRYDREAEQLVQQLNAQGVLLIVIDGSRGNGFSVSLREPRLLLAVPEILRTTADLIDKSFPRS